MCFYQVGNWHKEAFQEFELEDIARYGCMWQPTRVISCRSHNVKFSSGYYPGLDHQCRLFQTFA